MTITPEQMRQAERADRHRFFKREGELLGVMRRRNAPDLSDADLLLLGLDKAPKRLSQDHLATLCGCTRKTVNKIEQGGGYSDPYLYARMKWFVTPPSAKKGPRP